MFDILVDFNLKRKITLDKLGISFRKLTKKEKEKIMSEVDKVYVKNKEKIHEATKNFTSDNIIFNFELLKEDVITRSIIMFSVMMKENGFTFKTEQEIRKTLENVVIIDVIEEKITEYVEKENIIKIISYLLSLYGIYNKGISFDKEVRYDYSFILKDCIFDLKSDDYYLNLLVNLISRYEINNQKNDIKKVELSEEYLIGLNKFLSKLNKIEIRRFISVLDMFFTKNTMQQSRIISLTTIKESILITDDQNIKKNFILKAGTIINYYLKTDTERKNKAIKNLLNFAYDVRSCIVHGNEEKIIATLDSFKQKNEAFREFVEVTDSHSSKKNNAFKLAENVLIISVFAVIKFWIENPMIINYMKNN